MEDAVAIEELTEAIRLTQEYVGDQLLPPKEGWSWFDALTKYAPWKLEQPSEDYDLEAMAWVIIANAHGGDWDSASEEWRNAARKWRDEYHASFLSDVEVPV
jgi:hypothetical protein